MVDVIMPPEDTATAEAILEQAQATIKAVATARAGEQ